MILHFHNKPLTSRFQINLLCQSIYLHLQIVHHRLHGCLGRRLFGLLCLITGEIHGCLVLAESGVRLLHLVEAGADVLQVLGNLCLVVFGASALMLTDDTLEPLGLFLLLPLLQFLSRRLLERRALVVLLAGLLIICLLFSRLLLDQTLHLLRAER